MNLAKYKEFNFRWFEEKLSRFTYQHESAQSITPKRNLGLLLVDGNKMKGKLVPNPLKRLKVFILLLFKKLA